MDSSFSDISDVYQRYEYEGEEDEEGEVTDISEPSDVLQVEIEEGRQGIGTEGQLEGRGIGRDTEQDPGGSSKGGRVGGGRGCRGGRGGKGGRGRGRGSEGGGEKGRVGRGVGRGSAGGDEEGRVGRGVGRGRGSAGGSEGRVGRRVGRGSAGGGEEGRVGRGVGRGRGSAEGSEEGRVGQRVGRDSEGGGEEGYVGQGVGRGGGSAGGSEEGRVGRRGRGSRGGRRGRGSRGGLRSRVEQGGSSNEGGSREGQGGRRGRGRGRGRGGGRGRGVAGGSGHDAEVARIEGLRQDRRERLKVKVKEMTREELEDLVIRQVEREPGLIIDLMSATPPPSPDPQRGIPSWCVCGHCRPKPTDRENVCCGFMPDECLTRHGTFALIIDEASLSLQRAMWNDAYNLEGAAEEPGQANRSFRHAAYRSVIFWKHGTLGRGNRRVVPSCCSEKIHERYPSPNQFYTGFIPGRFV